MSDCRGRKPASDTRVRTAQDGERKTPTAETVAGATDSRKPAPSPFPRSGFQHRRADRSPGFRIALLPAPSHAPPGGTQWHAAGFVRGHSCGAAPAFHRIPSASAYRVFFSCQVPRPYIYHLPWRMSRAPDAPARLIVNRGPRSDVSERAEMCPSCARPATEDISFLESRIDASASSLLLSPCSRGCLAPEFPSADFPQQPVRASSERWTGTVESAPAGRRKGVIGRRTSSAMFATQ